MKERIMNILKNMQRVAAGLPACSAGRRPLFPRGESVEEGKLNV